MSEITLHTGFMGSRDYIRVEWFDENNVRRRLPIEIVIEDQDKPRTLTVLVDGRVAKCVTSHDIAHVIDNDRSLHVVS